MNNYTRVCCFYLLHIMHNDNMEVTESLYELQSRKLFTCKTRNLWHIFLWLMSGWHNTRGHLLTVLQWEQQWTCSFLSELLKALGFFFSYNLFDGKNNWHRWLLIKAVLIWLCLLYGEFLKWFICKYWSLGSGLCGVEVFWRMCSRKKTTTNPTLLKSELYAKITLLR